MLAVMALGHVARLESSDTIAWWRCITILEVLVAHSKCNYEALLVLITLYISYGMGSLAMQYYAQLSIKNVQNATVSWILYSRISTIHPLNPYQIGDQTPYDLLENLAKAVDWARTADRLAFSSLKIMLNRGQYYHLLDSTNSDKFLVPNLSNYMILCEYKRAARFSEIPHLKVFSSIKGKTCCGIRLIIYSLIWSLAVELPSRISDTRDSTPFPNCEAGGQIPFISLFKFRCVFDVRSGHSPLKEPHLTVL